ncbi:hypothetical protein [Mycolicibacterium pyrenivorans]|uniref:hypothetical protein n=1 Tax=Mycolicibacterium pyrenivorans TaxID=187102 RepID=UPI0021F35A99|nr:hypothetical protein [Mycolicibacterium pyrenivorans]MCV7151122.1 hypothetical protein [Mycolicibacterium pyrenivorans]
MSALWVYVRIQAMMFVFGLVGPIFLVVYFAAQPDTTLRWMYWWGLFITAGDVLLALLLAEGTVRTDRGKADKATAERQQARDG